MADTVSPATRSRMMAGIKGKNTAPEMLIRRGLHKLGFRFRLHDRKLPGKPDLVFPKYKAVVFVNGCFWHGHDCPLFRLPKTRADFWGQKINRNKAHDLEVIKLTIESGWRCATIRECALKGRGRMPAELLFRTCAKWLDSQKKILEISGV
jgi:DNA mismatch endonuclease, patch repair protein